jgi:hypothetical protein
MQALSRPPEQLAARRPPEHLAARTNLGFAGAPDQSHKLKRRCILRLKSEPRRLKGDSKPRVEHVESPVILCTKGCAHWQASVCIKLLTASPYSKEPTTRKLVYWPLKGSILKIRNILSQGDAEGAHVPAQKRRCRFQALFRDGQSNSKIPRAFPATDLMKFSWFATPWS